MFNNQIKNKVNETKFETWALVELMGHQKIAGFCTQENVAGVNMLRVDVPETDTSPSFTRFLGSAAIYAINPCTEDIVRSLAGRLQNKPVDSWDVSKFIEKNNLLSLPEPSEPDNDLESYM